MKIVAFNSTPRPAQTIKTDQPLQAFLAAAREAGADFEIYLQKYKIIPLLWMLRL